MGQTSDIGRREQADFVFESVSRLLQLALNQHELSGLTKLLECIAKECNAYGAVLLSLSEDLKTSERDRFVTVAQWFPDATTWPDSLPLASASGHAVLNNLRYLNVPDAHDPKEIDVRK